MAMDIRFGIGSTGALALLFICPGCVWGEVIGIVSPNFTAIQSPTALVAGPNESFSQPKPTHTLLLWNGRTHRRSDARSRLRADIGSNRVTAFIPSYSATVTTAGLTPNTGRAAPLFSKLALNLSNPALRSTTVRRGKLSDSARHPTPVTNVDDLVILCLAFAGTTIRLQRRRERRHHIGEFSDTTFSLRARPVATSDDSYAPFLANSRSLPHVGATVGYANSLGTDQKARFNALASMPPYGPRAVQMGCPIAPNIWQSPPTHGVRSKTTSIVCDTVPHGPIQAEPVIQLRPMESESLFLE